MSRLKLSNRIKEKKPVTGSACQVTDNLPSAWIMTTLGAISSKPQYGWTTKANHLQGKVRLLRTTDITPGTIDWSSVPFCTEEPEDLDKYLVRPGDIVISRAGSVGVSHLITNAEKAVFASYLIRFRPHDNVDKKYVAYFLKSPDYWSAIADNTSGIAVPNVNATKLEKIPIPLAPLDQQQRIVAEIEKQFSRLDEAVAGLKRVKANLKRYKAAVLKAAVEGRLVETEAELARREDRSYETGGQLLKRILDNRRSQWKGKGKYKEPAAPDTADLPGLPEGWVWATADQLMSLITDGEHITPHRSESGVLLLSARNVLNGRLDISDVDYISEEEHLRLLKRLAVCAGDVLLSCSGSVGRSCIVPDGVRFSLVRSVAVLRPLVIPSDFVCYQIQSPWLQSQIENRKTQTAQANIFQGKIRQLIFTLPPKVEQHRIVAEVDRRLSHVREVEGQVDANLTRAERLRQAILRNAFAGHLTPSGQNVRKSTIIVKGAAQ